jgi:hypothetical protein
MSGSIRWLEGNLPHGMYTPLTNLPALAAGIFGY